MGAYDDKVNAYAKLFGVPPATVAKVMGSPPGPASGPLPKVPKGPAPGDPGFASSVLGSAPAGPLPSAPRGPAPGDPGFDITRMGPMPSTAAPPPGAPVLSKKDLEKAREASQSVSDTAHGHGGDKPTINIPKGFADKQIDLSGVKKPATAMDDARAAVAESESARAGAPQGYFVKPHWAPHDEREATRYGMSKESVEPAKSAADDALGHGYMAGEKHLEAAQKQADADVAYATEHARASQEAAIQMKKIADDKRAYVERAQQKLEDLSLRAQEKVDVDAAQGGLGGSLMAAIGMAMGQFGASMNHTQNTAMQLVQSNIDRRIRAQEANIGNAHKTLANEENLYQKNLSAFGDRESAVLATKVQLLDQAKAMSDTQYAKAKHTMNEGDKHAFDEKLLKERSDTAMKFAVAQQNQVETQRTNVYNPGGFVGTGGPASKEAKSDAHGYSEELEKAGIPEALSSLQDIDQRLDSFGTGDVPGVGPVVNHLPGPILKLVSGQEGVRNRQALAHTKNLTRKVIAGVAQNPQETAHLNEELEGAGDADSMRAFVQSLRRSLSNRQRNIAAGHGEEGRKLYEDRKGSVHDVRQDRPTTPYQRPVDGK